MRARGDALTSSFVQMSRELSRGTPTIEDVAELEEYMAQLPAEMEEKQRGLSEMMADQAPLPYLRPPDPFTFIRILVRVSFADHSLLIPRQGVDR